MHHFCMFVKINSDGCDENKQEMKEKPKRDWIALFHYPYNDPRNQTYANGTNCETVLDQVF